MIAEMKDESIQVGWTTNLLPKVSPNTGAIIVQALEPVYLKPEMGNSPWKFATADGQTIAESTIQLMTKYTSREAKLQLAKKSFVTYLTQLLDIQTSAEDLMHKIAS